MKWIYTFNFLLFYVCANSSVVSSTSLRILPIFFTAIILGVKPAYIKFNFRDNWFIYLLVIQLLLSTLFSNDPHAPLIFNIFRVIYIISFVSLTIIFINTYASEIHILLLYGLIFPIFFYSILNYLYYLNIFSSNAFQLEDIGNAVLLKAIFGLDYPRGVFPLMGGLVNFSFVLGMLIIYSYFSLKWIKLSFLHIGILAFSILLLLIMDARGSVFSLLIIIALNRILLLRFTLKIFPFIIVLSPILLIVFLSIISTTKMGSVLARSDVDIATGNSRFFIWLACLEEVIQFKIEHIFGVGEYGAYKLGVSEQWGYLFSKFENSDFISPHNNMFSMLFDTGYLSICTYLYTVYKSATTQLVNIKEVYSKILKTFLIFLGISGVTDVPYGTYNLQNTFIILFIFFIIAYQQKLQVKYN